MQSLLISCYLVFPSRSGQVVHILNRPTLVSLKCARLGRSSAIKRARLAHIQLNSGWQRLRFTQIKFYRSGARRISYWCLLVLWFVRVSHLLYARWCYSEVITLNVVVVHFSIASRSNACSTRRTLGGIIGGLKLRRGRTECTTLVR